MPPRAAPRRLAGSRLGPARILFRRIVVVAGVVPARAPLVHVLAHVVQAVSVRRRGRYRLRTPVPPRRVIRPRERVLVAPGEQLLLQATPRGKLPFCFGRQPDRQSPSP